MQTSRWALCFDIYLGGLRGKARGSRARIDRLAAKGGIFSIKHAQQRRPGKLIEFARSHQSFALPARGLYRLCARLVKGSTHHSPYLHAACALQGVEQ